MTDHLLASLQSALGASHTVRRELGGGGMSRVFVADDRVLGREVVVKVLPPALAQGMLVERFRREIMFAAQLQHPNIVPVLASGEANGLPYYVMPFITGESLKERLGRGPLSVREAALILRDVARALGHAHGRGLVHRDIKPGNILLTAGAASVADFGVAKALAAATRPDKENTSVTMTDMGVSLGTPAYMAPEQVSADPSIDHRADLYALGIVAYEMLVGAPPFAGRSVRATMAAHLAERPPRVDTRRYDVPPTMADLVDALLQKDPDHRPKSADVVVRALDDTSFGSGAREAMAGSQWLGGTPGRGGRPSLRALALGAAAVLALAAAAVALVRKDDGAVPGGAPPGFTRIAVAEAALFSAEPGARAFAATLPAELAVRLSALDSVEVIAPSAAGTFSPPGTPAAPATTWARLETTVQDGPTPAGTGARPRVHALLRLVTTPAGIVRWAESATFPADSASAVQARLADAAARAVRREREAALRAVQP